MPSRLSLRVLGGLIPDITTACWSPVLSTGHILTHVLPQVDLGPAALGTSLSPRVQTLGKIRVQNSVC